MALAGGFLAVGDFVVEIGSGGLVARKIAEWSIDSRSPRRG
jgi:hypothetical protein